MGSPCENPYEARLVERFRQGDSQAMSTLFEMNVDRVYGYARHILGNRDDAEEVVGEAFIRAFRRAESFRGESAFLGWLFGITRNLCRDRIRQPRLLTVPVDDAEISEEQVNHRLRDDVRSALSGLPDDQQEILVICDVEEWDAREAAELMGRTVAATKSLLYRARRGLRARLTEIWREEGRG